MGRTPYRAIDDDSAQNGNQFWQFVLEIADDLSGGSVEQFVRTALARRPERFVIVRDLEGALLGFQDRTTFSCTVEDFMTKVGQAQQYNWGFFFLVSEIPADLQSRSDEDLIKLSPISIQLVDSGYIYLYTADIEVIKAHTRAYPRGKATPVSLSHLEVPY